MIQLPHQNVKILSMGNKICKTMKEISDFG